MEEENDCGQCPVCVGRVEAYYPEGQERAGH